MPSSPTPLLKRRRGKAVLLVLTQRHMINTLLSHATTLERKEKPVSLV